jgi:imidazolonepropionase-like amidohydrolase
MTGYAPYLAYYQRESEVGHKIAPSIFYAAQFAGPGYFKMFENQSSKPMGVSPWERAITDTTDIEKAVKEAKEIGATGIKTYAELSESQFSTIVKAAKKNGLLVWSHATIFPIQPSDIAKYKIQSLSHAADVLFEQLPKDSVDLSYAWQRVYQGMKPDQEVLQSLFSQMKTNHIFFDPTVFHATNNRLNYSTDIVRWAHQAGVKIVAGTDWIYSEDKDEMVPLYDEVWLYMEKSGLSALEAIETLTSHGATVIGLNDRGLIRKGKRADILILDQNPLSDIRALFEPNTVIKKGNIIFDRDK